MADKTESSGNAVPTDEGATTQSLSRLFELHNRDLVAFLRRRLGSEAEAWEIAQEAYAQILQLDRPGTINFLRAYLFKTATNLATNRVRDRSRAEQGRQDVPLDDLPHELGPFRETAGRDDLDTLREALAELPARLRNAFIARRVHGLSSRETCQKLGIAERQPRQDVQKATLYCLLRMDGMSAADAQSRTKR